MAMPKDPRENTAAVEQAVQWMLDDLFKHKQQPSADDVALIKGTSIEETIQAFSDALKAGGEIGLKAAWNTICKDIDEKNQNNGHGLNWLVELKSRPVPPRPGTEGEQTAEKEEDLPHGTHVGKSGKIVFTRMSEDDIENLLDISFRIQMVMPEVGVSLWYGPSGTGKTFVAYHTAQCLARGEHWFGRRVTGCKTLYIYAEGKLGLKLRQKAWYKHYQKAKSGNLTFITMPIHLIEQRGTLISTIEDMIAEGEKPDVIFIDTFSNCTSGLDQNLQNEVEPVLQVCHEIRETYEVQIVIIHHTNKSDEFNGSQAFKNHIDTMIKLSSDEIDTELLTMECRKQRDGAEKFLPFQLRLLPVDLGTDPKTNDPISSSVVIAVDGGMVRDKNEEVLHTMLDVLSQHGMINKTKWQEYCKEEGIQLREFNRSFNILLNKSKISVRKGEKNSQICEIAHGKEV